MFYGSQTHSVDSVGRFVLPKKYRNSLGDDFIITKGLGCLCIFTKDYVDLKLTRELESLGSPLQSLLNPDIVRLSRHFFSEMVTTNDDSQSRVTLTPEHRRYAGIADDVVICGCGGYIELWSPSALETYRDQQDRVEDLIASGAALLPQPGTRHSERSEESYAGISQTGPGQ